MPSGAFITQPIYCVQCLRNGRKVEIDIIEPEIITGPTKGKKIEVKTGYEHRCPFAKESGLDSIFTITTALPHVKRKRLSDLI